MARRKFLKSKRKHQVSFRPSLFWDVDPKIIDPQKHARYVIERILDFGTSEEIRWLFAFYSKRQLKSIMDLPRSPLHEKSKSLWSLLLRQKS